MSVGFKIRKLREEKDYSQPHLASLLGISQSELSKIENEQTKKIDFLLFYKVCKELDVDFRYFTESNQINNIEKLEGCVNNHGTINMTPKNVLSFIETVFAENIKLKKENEILKSKK